MIKPHKFMNLELSLLNISSYIITDLKKEKIQSYDNLLISVSRNFEDDIKDLFVLALTFLYSIGVVDYNKMTDQVVILL